ncbi:MAG TPA: glycosyltransferase family 9 protein [Methylomirabilota bacterium]|nr:glycosyltransferase family 9 protein [Methylomirabilota bacterium]
MKRTKGKILVIRGGAIGDFVLTLPAFRALREQFPETHIEALGYPHIAQLALAGGFVDEVRSIEARPLASFFARRGRLSAEMAEYFSSFSLIISYLYDPDGIFQENVRSVSKAQFIVGQHRPDEEQPLHAAEVFLKPLERLAIYEADFEPRIEFGGGANGGRQVVALHPGSGSERKNWPLRDWVSLIERLLTETQHELLIVGGEADRERLATLASQYTGNRVRILQGAHLSELARELGRAKLFIGHDSGVTHIAAAVGAPVVALWGPSNPVIWKPLGEKVRVIQTQGSLATLKPEAVWEQIAPLLA